MEITISLNTILSGLLMPTYQTTDMLKIVDTKISKRGYIMFLQYNATVIYKHKIIVVIKLRLSDITYFFIEKSGMSCFTQYGLTKHIIKFNNTRIIKTIYKGAPKKSKYHDIGILNIVIIPDHNE